MLPQDQLSDELVRSLVPYELQDVYLLLEVLHSLLVAPVPEVSPLPPQAILAN